MLSHHRPVHQTRKKQTASQNTDNHYPMNYPATSGEAKLPRLRRVLNPSFTIKKREQRGKKSLDSGKAITYHLIRQSYNRYNK